MKIKIEIELDNDINMYTVSAVGDSGEVTLECLTLAELDKLTIGELKELMEENE